MNIYVFGKSSQTADVQVIQNQLRKKGHLITFDWTLMVDYYKRNPEKLTPVIEREESILCLSGVCMADVAVGYVPDKLEYRGAFVEMGIALAMGIPVILLGHGMDSCIFTNHPLVSHADIPGLISKLAIMESENENDR